MNQDEGGEGDTAGAGEEKREEGKGVKGGGEGGVGGDGLEGLEEGLLGSSKSEDMEGVGEGMEGLEEGSKQGDGGDEGGEGCDGGEREEGGDGEEEVEGKEDPEVEDVDTARLLEWRSADTVAVLLRIPPVIRTTVTGLRTVSQVDFTVKMKWLTWCQTRLREQQYRELKVRYQLRIIIKWFNLLINVLFNVGCFMWERSSIFSSTDTFLFTPVSPLYSSYDKPITSITFYYTYLHLLAPYSIGRQER
jgi:hypothetical protein